MCIGKAGQHDLCFLRKPHRKARPRGEEANRQEGGGPGGCIFSCALPPCSTGRRAEGRIAAAGARAQRGTGGLILHSPPRHSRNSHQVPLKQECQSAGSVTGPCGAWPLSPRGAFRIVMRYFSQGEQPRGCAHPILLGCPSAPAQGHLVTGVLLVPEEICLPGRFQQALGQSGWQWGPSAEVNSFSSPGQALGKLVPFQHTRGCPEVWALLLHTRQVMSHVLTCGLVCREEGCCRAGHTGVACLVVAIPQSWATVSLLWGKEVAEAWLCSAAGTGRSCLHTRTLPPLQQQSDAICV